MNRRLEPLACRIHDAVVCSGSEDEQELCQDWYQKQAIQEPCPACEAIAEVLANHERLDNRRKIGAIFSGLAIGATFFLAGVCSTLSQYGNVERWGTVSMLLGFGICYAWHKLIRNTLL